MTPTSPRELAAALNRPSRVSYVPTPAAGTVAVTARAPLAPRVGEVIASALTATSAAAARPGDDVGSATRELLVFRVGSERFALPLGTVEEALEWGGVHAIPECPGMLLGVAELRGMMLPVFAPGDVLCAACDGEPSILLVVLGAEGRIGLAVDDVDDVHAVSADALRAGPGRADADAILVAVTRRGGELVSVLDADALVGACLSRRLEETAA